MSASAAQTRLTGKHILLILLTSFAIVSAVNGAFIYFALSTGPGEERDASYETGLKYNAILSEERSQEALQWRHQSQIENARLRVSISDKGGAPIAGLSVTGHFGRPASNGDDSKLTFKEVDAGVYEADLSRVGAGSWVLAFAADKARRGAEGTTYRVKERLWVSQGR